MDGRLKVSVSAKLLHNFTLGNLPMRQN